MSVFRPSDPTLPADQAGHGDLRALSLTTALATPVLWALQHWVFGSPVPDAVAVEVSAVVSAAISYAAARGARRRATRAATALPSPVAVAAPLAVVQAPAGPVQPAAPVSGEGGGSAGVGEGVTPA